MPVFKKKQKAMKPARVLAIGFFIIIVCGAALLCLPFASKSGECISFTDALFTATSATCVTGIALFDTYSVFTIFGQTVIMLLMQVGGIGFLTIVTFFNVTIRKKMGLTQTKNAAAEYDLDGLDGVKKLFSHIILYSFIIEIAGAISLMFTFVPKYNGYGVFMAFFQSISAFCNGGFDVMGIEGAGVGMSNYSDNPAVLITMMILIITGGLGFVVWENLTNYHKTKKLYLHTKVVLITSALLIIFGAAVYFTIECTDAAFENMSVGERVLNAFFSSVSSRTAGFTAAPLPSANEFSKLFSMLIMFVGAAPASTGGGMKVTTLAIIAATIMSVIKNKDETTILRHRVKEQVVYKTLTVLSLSLALTMVSFFIVFFANGSENAIDTLFETVSAFSTTGYSVGVSADSCLLAQLTLILTMFIGRIGPVSLILSLSLKHKDEKGTILPVGDILVG